MSYRKINFCCKSDLPIKLFRASVTNTDIGNLKSLHAFPKKCFYQMLVKFEQNRMIQTTRNFELFDKKKNKQTNKNKTGFLKSFLTKSWRHFARRFCNWINYLMLNYFKDYNLSEFQKYGSPTRITRLKATLNMADPISLNKNLP